MMGKQFYYCGGPGMGLQAKLTQNLILANIMQAFNEGITLSTKAGVDPALMLEILNNSAAKSGVDRLQGSVRLQTGLHHQFFHKMDAQRHRFGPGFGRGAGLATTRPPAPRNRCFVLQLQRVTGMRHVLHHPGGGTLGGR